MILINRNTKVIVQGITGHHGAAHTKIMHDYGTQIVAGVTPGKGNQKVHNIPVYNTVKQALKHHKATYSIIFVPAPFAKDAALEALQNNLNIVLVTEHMPIHDVIAIKQEAKKRNKIMIGPNSPGIICPGLTKIGIVPQQFFKKGKVGVISRSGTLTYEIINHLTQNNLGQSTVIGIGGDAVNGFSFIDALRHFAKDKDTLAIVMVGEIGGTAEEDVAAYIKKTKYKKPVVAYIAGVAAPKGKRMGHAGALIQGTKGTAASKIAALKDAGVKVVILPKDVVKPLA
jgi:succinyl-CoA synthetase alpha subunit